MYSRRRRIGESGGERDKKNRVGGGEAAVAGERREAKTRDKDVVVRRRYVTTASLLDKKKIVSVRDRLGRETKRKAKKKNFSFITNNVTRTRSPE